MFPVGIYLSFFSLGLIRDYISSGTLVAETADIVDLKDGLLNNRDCALRNPEVKSYSPYKRNTHCTDVP